MLLNTKQIAKELNVNERTIWVWIKQGRIKSIRIGRNFKIDEKELQYVMQNGLRKQYVDTNMLRDIEKTMGLSYQQIAKELGVSCTTIYNWIKGKTNPTEKHIKALLDYCKRYY